jgi:hypothetical protein
MNLEFDDSNQVEIHFTQKGLRRRYRVRLTDFSIDTETRHVWKDEVSVWS